MQLLLIEDWRSSCDWLADHLGHSGFVVTRSGSAREALDSAVARAAEAIIVDLGMGRVDGQNCVSRLRDGGLDQPLLILSPESNWREKVDCLNLGADDFLVKPIRAEEVTARMRAIIRRFAGCATDRMKSGDAELDLKARRAWIAGEPLDLTRNEFRLLRLFIMRPDRFVSSEELLGQLYARKQDRGTNSVEVQIARLRRKIGKDRIQTLRGVGYRLVPECVAACQIEGSESAAPQHLPEETFANWAPHI